MYDVEQYPVKRIVKRDGRVVDFDPERIRNAIRKAMVATGKLDEQLLDKVTQHVLQLIAEKFGTERIPHVEDVQDLVELTLVKFDLYEVAKAYILYRKERERIRKEKMRILEKDYLDEVDKRFSVNALRLMASRYLLRNEEGKLIEGPKQMFQRIAALVVIPDLLYDPRVFDVDRGQPVHPNEEFDPVLWEGKLGLRDSEGNLLFTWNRWHLDRMKALYDRLNSEGAMRVPFSRFLEMLRSGELDDHAADYLRYYDLMAEKKFMPNSPTLFNAGTRLGQLSACFVLPIDDNMESIMKAATDAAMIFKSGGGIGINYSKLRPEGDIVASTSGVASGPVTFMRIIDTVTDVVKQGGKRRGANMGILEVWHPDIEKFVRAKEQPGVLENFNISVLIEPSFWEHLERNEPYPLINPRNGKVWGRVNPRHLFRLIAQMAWKTADPGVLFLDNINRRNVLRKALGEIRATNPCVTGDTWVMTAEGPRQVKELVGRPVDLVINGRVYRSESGFFSTGVKPVLRLVTREGYELRLTGDHPVAKVTSVRRKWIGGGWSYEVSWEWCRASDLRPGDKVLLNDHRALAGWPGELGYEEGLLVGALAGDGWITNGGRGRTRAVIAVWAADGGAAETMLELEEAASHLPHRSDWGGWIGPHGGRYVMRLSAITELAARLGLRSGRGGARVVTPELERQSSEFYRGYLRALFDSDGSVQGSHRKGVSLRLAQSDLAFLKSVQRMLLRLGIFSRIYKRRDRAVKPLPDGRGGYREYETAPQYELVISNESLVRFAELIGLSHTEKRRKLLEHLASYRRRPNGELFVATVESVYPDGVEEVYDVSVPGINAFDANGLLVHNCGEEPLYEYEVCNLGSVNLHAFVKRVNGKAEVDWEALAETVRIAYRFLDNVIDVNNYPLKEIDEMAHRTRRVGLGIMGLADMLYALRIPYNSEEGFEAMQRVMEFVAWHAYMESAKRAKERGPFPLYWQSSYPEGHLPLEGFYHRELWTMDWDRVVEEIKRNGIRNSFVLSIAPTGSISMLVDTSSGLEPVFALVYEKRVTVGTFYYIDPEFERYLEERGMKTDEVLKRVAENGGSIQGLDDLFDEEAMRVFVVAYDIPWWDHVRAQYHVGLWVDAAVSKTINMPSWVTVEDVEAAYLFAYRLGLKGITIYRDQSKPGQVLVTPSQRTERYVLRVRNNTIEMMRSLGIDVTPFLRHLEEKSPEEAKVFLKVGPAAEEVEGSTGGGRGEVGAQEACPVCGSRTLIHQSGCVTCADCGWSVCVSG
ncbi:MAG: ribonucleotide reductase N-terminal alpha domain-containing protein [Nitrososphaerota archaeon]